MPDFVPLHVHTDYSMLDGACRVKDLAETAAAWKLPAVACTDHGNMCGAVEFYQEMTSRGVKPILGTEFYVAPGHRTDRNSREPHAQGYHLVLLAKDLEGYRNLCRLNSAAFLEGYYYKPRIDRELLARHHGGLIALTACIGGEVPSRILEGAEKRATQALREYLDIFGKDDLFVEVQDHGMPEEAQANRALFELATQHGLGVVATNDSHYLKKEHAAAHEILLCIGTQTNINDPKRMRFAGPEFYFKSPEEMHRLFAQHPEALANTLAVAERCNLQLKIGDKSENHYPVYDAPDGLPREQYIRQLCLEAMKERYGVDVAAGTLTVADQEKLARLDLELGIIQKTGFVSYFLVVWDFLHHARLRGIPVGPGRGSGAGSIVAYLLHITDIDPLRYGLLFERFLNPDRVSPPDFDIDLCERRRHEVIAYVRGKYGSANVSQIGTFGTLKARAVIKDVVRAMGRSFEDGNNLTKLIPADPKMTLGKAVTENPELARRISTEPWVKEVLDHSYVLEGLNRNMSIHAAGVIIGDQALTNLVPLARGAGADEEVITQFPAPNCEALGLLKMDFLGLRTLTIIDDTVTLIKLNTGKQLDLDTLSLSDPATYELLRKGNTVAVFQLESSGFRDLCRRFAVSRIEDIIAMIALYRPGPMQFLEEFISRKNGQTPVLYDVPTMKPILEETYGIMLYQEQVMQVVQKVAGFSLGQADILRRAMGKKKAKDMEKQYAKFLEGTGKKGISPEVANAVWEKIVMFAGYGFNKSHSAAYGLLSYRTAYLKANHPVEFMAAVLSSELGNAEKLAFFLTECRDMDITIMGPDVNVSGRQFSVDKAVIRFGLAAIKGVGEGAADAIIAARQEGGPFTSLDNFCERCGSKVNRRVMECLSKAGAFDRFGLKRAQTVAMLDDVMSRGQQVAQDRNRGQGLLFDFGMGGGGADMAKPPDVPEWPARELFGYEKELLGFYVTGHPLRDQEELLRAFQTESAGLLADVPNDTPVRVGGMVTVVSPKVSKKDNRPWVIFSLEGVDGVSECFVFADRWAKSPEIAEILLPKEEPPGPDGTAAAKPDKTPAVFVEGTVNTRNEGEPPKIVVERVIRLADAPPQFTAELHVRIPENPETSVRLLQLRELCGRHAGTTPVILCLICQNGDIGFIRPEGLGITNSMAFRAAVKELFGADCLVEKPARVAVEVKRRFDRDRHNGNGRPPA